MYRQHRDVIAPIVYSTYNKKDKYQQLEYRPYCCAPPVDSMKPYSSNWINVVDQPVHHLSTSCEEEKGCHEHCKPTKCSQARCETVDCRCQPVTPKEVDLCVIPEPVPECPICPQVFSGLQALWANDAKKQASRNCHKPANTACCNCNKTYFSDNSLKKDYCVPISPLISEEAEKRNEEIIEPFPMMNCGCCKDMK
nr:uncharacterized protein LOC107452108 [Parasteatoda tepidariorum]